MKVSLLSIVSLVSLVYGIALGVTIIINLMNGNILETVTPYSYIPMDPDLYPYSHVPDVDPTYQYTTLTKTGDITFRLCAFCFAVGIVSIISPAIYSMVLKNGK